MGKQADRVELMQLHPIPPPSVAELAMSMVLLGMALSNLSRRWRDRGTRELAKIARRGDGSVGVFVRAATTASIPIGALGLAGVVAFIAGREQGGWLTLLGISLIVVGLTQVLYLLVVLFNRPKWAVHPTFRKEPGLVTAIVKRFSRKSDW